MRAFSYERPETLADALAVLAANGRDARPLVGGTDLIIRLRDGTVRPRIVLDLKRIPELRPRIDTTTDVLTIGATTAMTDIAAHGLVRQRFLALAEAAAVVGSVQIRNRASLGGNICNASPAADTATPLLIYGAVVVAEGPDGSRRIPIRDFFIRSGETALRPEDLVLAIEIPIPGHRTGSVHLRRTRRRGHDLASVTMSCLVDGRGITRLAFGSVGPRPILVEETTGMLADPGATDGAKSAILETIFDAATPSQGSMRASPEYRLAMLRVLGRRAIAIAIDRLAQP
jgi:CO/xanthine dehydrogenase FAD-binding subunit